MLIISEKNTDNMEFPTAFIECIVDIGNFIFKFN